MCSHKQASPLRDSPPRAHPRRRRTPRWCQRGARCRGASPTSGIWILEEKSSEQATSSCSASAWLCVPCICSSPPLSPRQGLSHFLSLVSTKSAAADSPTPCQPLSSPRLSLTCLQAQLPCPRLGRAPEGTGKMHLTRPFPGSSTGLSLPTCSFSIFSFLMPPAAPFLTFPQPEGAPSPLHSRHLLLVPQEAGWQSPAVTSR